MIHTVWIWPYYFLGNTERHEGPERGTGETERGEGHHQTGGGGNGEGFGRGRTAVTGMTRTGAFDFLCYIFQLIQ